MSFYEEQVYSIPYLLIRLETNSVLNNLFKYHVQSHQIGVT